MKHDGSSSCRLGGSQRQAAAVRLHSQTQSYFKAKHTIVFWVPVYIYIYMYKIFESIIDRPKDSGELPHKWSPKQDLIKDPEILDSLPTYRPRGKTILLASLLLSSKKVSVSTEPFICPQNPLEKSVQGEKPLELTSGRQSGLVYVTIWLTRWDQQRPVSCHFFFHTRDFLYNSVRTHTGEAIRNWGHSSASLCWLII